VLSARAFTPLLFRHVWPASADMPMALPAYAADATPRQPLVSHSYPPARYPPARLTTSITFDGHHVRLRVHAKKQ